MHRICFFKEHALFCPFTEFKDQRFTSLKLHYRYIALAILGHHFIHNPKIIQIDSRSSTSMGPYLRLMKLLARISCGLMSPVSRNKVHTVRQDPVSPKTWTKGDG